jgi:putative chitinase
MAIPPALTRLLEVERSQLGIQEHPHGSNHVKYNTAYYGHPVHNRAHTNYAWCVVFQWWCFQRAGIPTSVFPKSANVFAVRDWYKKKGRFDHTPRVGSLAIFSFSHIALVEKVLTHGRVQTIEGNTDTAGGRTGGKVMRKVRRSGIQGFCHPDYGHVPAATHAPRPPDANPHPVVPAAHPVVLHQARRPRAAAAQASVERMRVGILLRLPGNSAKAMMKRPTHRVVAGDTLSQIAQRNGTSVARLAALNGIKNPDHIQVGMLLRLPGFSPLSRLTHPPRRHPPGVGDKPATPAHSPAKHVGGGLSSKQLGAIMPQLPQHKITVYLPHLNDAMHEGQITSPLRMAAFLAQLAHESVQLRYFEEIASGAAYEGRRSLGNTHRGDGRRFKGRGPIQLTGRANYAAASKALKVDLLHHPEQAATAKYGFRIAQWFWTTHGLNQLADQRQFIKITLRINGGTKGERSRETYYLRAKHVLGA